MIRFGECRFDPEARELRCRGQRAELTPKAMDLLGILLQARPRAMAKTELRDRLWPDTAVADTSLAKLVTELRHAIGDAARAPRFIRTLHRRGYAFCGDARDAAATPGGDFRCGLFRGGDEIGLAEGDNLIGRAPDCVVRIDSTRVSRHHARIRVSEDDAVVEDLGSKNGTFLRGRKVSAPTSLAKGDEIRVGPVVLIFGGAYGSLTTETG